LIGSKLSPVPFYWLIVGVLAVWRITHLLHAEDGPWNALSKLRRQAGTGIVGSLLGCFYCLSLWVSLPFAYGLGEGWWERLLLWPALSGAAILLQNVSQRVEPPSFYYEESESEHVLRKEQNIVHANETGRSKA
jgi:hypothetical protein